MQSRHELPYVAHAMSRLWFDSHCIHSTCKLKGPHAALSRCYPMRPDPAMRVAPTNPSATGQDVHDRRPGLSSTLICSDTCPLIPSVVHACSRFMFVSAFGTRNIRWLEVTLDSTTQPSSVVVASHRQRVLRATKQRCTSVPVHFCS
jgi:hypothetical protein